MFAGRASVVLMLTRMNSVLEVNVRDRCAVVEAGVCNSQLAKALVGTGYYFAAEPSSQGASSIGGNVATNACGAGALKSGATVNHVLALEAVLADGSIIKLGPLADPASLDLTGLLAGSEGTLAVVTKVWLRLTPAPANYRTMRAIFDCAKDAVNCVTQILGAGIIPSAMEFMDQGLLSAVNQSLALDMPADAGPMLLIELDGPETALDGQQSHILSLLKKNNAQNRCGRRRRSQEREDLWKCRKSAFFAAAESLDFTGNATRSSGRCAATGQQREGLLDIGAILGENRTAPVHCNYIIEDCVVPRTRLPQMLQKIAEIGEKNQVRIISAAHAGDGNLHPIILYDERDQASLARAMAAGGELLDACIASGGSATGEHGIGARKSIAWRGNSKPPIWRPCGACAIPSIPADC